MVRPKYNTETGEFLGLCKTFSYMLVRGSPEEVIFIMGLIKKIQRSYILTIEEESRMPSVEPCLIGISC